MTPSPENCYTYWNLEYFLVAETIVCLKILNIKVMRKKVFIALILSM